MSSKEFQQLLARLPDLAHKYARQRLWSGLRIWSLRIGITALAVAGSAALVKVLYDAHNPAPLPQPEPVVIQSPSPETQTASGQTAYDLPNPEIRQELLINRHSSPTTRPAQ